MKIETLDMHYLINHDAVSSEQFFSELKEQLNVRLSQDDNLTFEDLRLIVKSIFSQDGDAIIMPKVKLIQLHLCQQSIQIQKVRNKI